MPFYASLFWYFLNEQKKRHKVFYFLVLIICLGGLFITKSRGSYVGFIVGLVFVLWIHYRSILKFSLILIGLVAAAFPLFYLTEGYERFMQIFEFTDTASVRLSMWQKAWELFSRSSLLGVGFGRFDDIFLLRGNERFIGFNGMFSLYAEP